VSPRIVASETLLGCEGGDIWTARYVDETEGRALLARRLQRHQLLVKSQDVQSDKGRYPEVGLWR
jgi:hypothetical protein